MRFSAELRNCVGNPQPTKQQRGKSIDVTSAPNTFQAGKPQGIRATRKDRQQRVSLGGLKRLCVRPHLEQSPCQVLHDNVPAHTAINVSTFHASPPNSPGLVPAEFFLFHKLKLKLKGRLFDKIVDIQNKMTAELNHIPEDEFFTCFRSSYGRCRVYLVPRRLF